MSEITFLILIHVDKFWSTLTWLHHIILQVCQLHSLWFDHIPKGFCPIQIWWLGRSLKWTEGFWLTWLLLCGKVHCIVLEEAGSSISTRWTAAFKQWLIGIPLPITAPLPVCTVDTRQVGSMESRCWRQILTLPSAASAEIQTLPTRFFFVQSSAVQCCPLQPQFPVPAWQEWNLTTKPISLKVPRDVHSEMLLGSPQGGYLSDRGLSVSSDQSGHSNLTSHFRKVFFYL